MPSEAIHRGPEYKAAIALLAAVNLPVEDLTPAHCRDFFYMGLPGLPTALVGLEMFGDVALLRSLAVAQGSRGSGAGSRLVSHAEDCAREEGIKALYVLTLTAESFFARRGYVRLPREAAPPAIRRSREFSSLCPAGSAFMIKPLS